MSQPTPEQQKATTPTWGLPYPNETDPADVPTDLAALCNRLETVLSQIRSGGSIPGEVKMWSGSALPAPATYGTWVWADGAAYDAATYPIAAAAIAAAWKTHGGKADPGAGKFRVPDLRGQTPIGLDAMPGGARANRITRSIAATLAGVTGEEYHALVVAEQPVHNHGISDPGHAHGVSDGGHYHTLGGGTNQSVNQPGTGAPGGYGGGFLPSGDGNTNSVTTGIGVAAAGTGVSVGNSGSGGAHENLPTTTFVPYIVKLDN